MPQLTFVPPPTFADLWSSAKGTPQERAAAFADLARVNTLSMVMEAGSGHLGSSFSALDMLSWLYLHELGACDGDAAAPLRGTFFSSKGHDAPGLYAVLTATGRLDFDLVHRLRREGGLPGHPDVRIPWLEANTGSLGMGISKAKGMIEAARLRGERAPVHVMTGDGELQEGQIWESLQGAANRGLGELTVIVDHNKIQSDTWVARVSDLGDLEAKFAAFGWTVRRCSGHDLPAVSAALDELAADTGRPGVLIADTTKGRGVSFMEEFAPDGDLYPFHSGAPSPASYAAALAELLARATARAADLGVTDLGLETREIAERTPVAGAKLVDAWSAALVARATSDPRIVALDGDLVLDTGLVAFRKAHPERFLECGIAEQDMVSQAGGLALRGFVPVVHSFASFLSGRPHEQVLVNSTEGTKILYVGSLAGIVPGGPGHSHQAVTDLASFGMVHGLLTVEPTSVDEIGPLLDLLVDTHEGSAYVRLTSPPVDLGFAWPSGGEGTGAAPRVGVGTRLRQGSDVTLVGAGPVVMREVVAAAAQLESRGISAGVVAQPWANALDEDWWDGVLASAPVLVTVENHSPHGGLGSHLLSRTALRGWGGRCAQVSVDTVPACGTNDEVLRAHGLDAASLVGRVEALLSRATA